MQYLDASVVVAALTVEPHSAAARSVVMEEVDLVASGWTMVEAASGLAKKVRNKEITSAELEVALRRLRLLEAEHLPLLAILEAHLSDAGRYTERPEPALRAGDALHVAIAASAAAVLVTLDKPLARAAEDLGLAVRLLA